MSSLEELLAVAARVHRMAEAIARARYRKPLSKLHTETRLDVLDEALMAHEACAD